MAWLATAANTLQDASTRRPSVLASPRRQNKSRVVGARLPGTAAGVGAGAASGTVSVVWGDMPPQQHLS